MAIYSLHHAAIGKRTQKAPHTAAAHVGYIARRRAMSRYESARLAGSPGRDAALLRSAEDADRANARVADKVRLALPRELDSEQRARLVRSFAEEITQGRAPWLAAFHDQGKDAHNPHCHLLIRDRDPTTGRRVIGMSEAGSTDQLRAAWERHANRALEEAGHAERVDRRTLAEQGIDRRPTIHEGPRSQQMVRRGARPQSRPVNARTRPGARSRERVVDYPRIDGGRSRPAYNQALRAPETPQEVWATLDADAQTRELAEQAAQGGGGIEGSVEAVGLATSQGIEAVPGRATPDEIRPIFFNPPETAFQPPPEGVGRGQAKDPPAHALTNGRENGSKPLIDEVGQQNEHDSYIGRDSENVKGGIMGIDDDVARLNYRKYVENRHQQEAASAEFNNFMQRAYLTPEKAKQQMFDYRDAKGHQALKDRVRDRPSYFGRPPGSLMSEQFWQPGALNKQRDARRARAALPGALDSYFTAAHSLDTARTAYESGPKVPDQSTRQPATMPERSTRMPRVSGHLPDIENERHQTDRATVKQPTPQPSPGPHRAEPSREPMASFPYARAPEQAPQTKAPDPVRDQRKAELMKGMADRQARERELDKERSR